MSEKEEGELSFLGHLEVLRWHLVRSVLAVVAGGLVAFFNKSLIYDTIILGPKNSDFLTYRMLCKLGEYMGTQAICIDGVNLTVQNRTMAGQFTSHLWVSLIAGFVVAFPYVMWEIWRFIKPGLTKNEAGNARGLVFYSSFLFSAGVVFGYFLITPLSVNFLGSYTVSSDVLNEIDLSSFVSTVTTITLATGVMFQLPIVIFFLTKIGLVTPDLLKKYRKHALVVILILSAIITPPDVSSQILVSVPILFLYEISIFISRIVLKRMDSDD